MFSVDSEGFQVVLDLAGLRSTSTASAASRAFAKAASGHAATTVPHFLNCFSPQDAISWHIGCGDEAIRKLCRASLRLLCAEPSDVRHLAGRVQDAANEVLQATSSDDCRTLARTVRSGARETLQAVIDGLKPKFIPKDDLRLAGCEFQRQQVLSMAKSFGVYTDPVSGIDFVLDHKGRAAYAFKPFPADPQGLAALMRAWTMTRFHAALSHALEWNLGHASSTIQCLPMDLGSEDGNAAPAGEADDFLPLLRPGLLMAAPLDFELVIDAGAIDGRLDAGRSADSLFGALDRRLNKVAFRRLVVSALCMGETAPSLGQVLVDRKDNTWILDPERYFAPTTPGPGTPSGGRRPASRPLVSPQALQALAQKGLRDHAGNFLDKLRHLDPELHVREQRLFNEALQENGEAKLEDFTSIGVSKEAIDRAAAQIGVVSDWATQVLETKRNADSVSENDRDGILEVVTEARTIDTLLDVVQRPAAEPRPAD